MNCKPGCIAFIKSAVNPEDVGRMLKVVCFLGAGRHIIEGRSWGNCASDTWLCEMIGEPIYNRVRGESCMRIAAPDCCLQPILPPEQPETITTDEEATA